MAEVSEEFEIKNEYGFHARPAASFVKTASKFSCDIKVEKDGQFTLVLDGKPLKNTYTKVWDPVFSPDSQYILLRALEGSGSDTIYTRSVLPLNEFLG